MGVREATNIVFIIKTTVEYLPWPTTLKIISCNLLQQSFEVNISVILISEMGKLSLRD